MGRKRTTNFDLPPRLQRKGNAFYYVCNGKPRKWIPLGTDLAKAKRQWAELEAGTATDNLTVGQLVQKYIDREQRAENTQRSYHSLQRSLADAFPIPAAELTAQHVALWREMQHQRRAWATQCITLLNAATRVGAEQGLCNALNVRGFELQPRDRILTPEEFRAIRNCAPPWLQTAMDLGYLTGARPVDLRALRWDQVGERLAIRQQKTKRRQEFLMTAELQAVFEQARKRPVLGLYVLANAKGRAISQPMFSRAWTAARRKAKVDASAQFRDIRAMAAAAANADGQDFQNLLGHTSRAMSERYLKAKQTFVVDPVRRKL